MKTMENNNYKKEKSVLEKFLKAKFPEHEFTKGELDFLVRYKIINEGTEKNILIDLLGKQFFTKVDDYYADHPYVKKANEQLQAIHNRFKSLCKRDSNAFHGFMGFFEWWCDEMDEQGQHYCYYCKVKEYVSKAAFESKKIESKKFTGGLQIDRKNPNKGYNKENCVFSCVLCNNAKSDMISAEDYEKYFGKATKTFWEHISNEN